MQQYKIDFLDFAFEQNVLKFGEFILKSGRKSPYFFNAGVFKTGEAMSKLGRVYAQAIIDSGISFDLLFGPAYKGIPLATAVSIALNDHHDLNKPWSFNRKEVKDHGEGGNIVGADLEGKALIVDDVISAGTAIREVMELIGRSSAKAAGVIVALDRQERGQGELSAIQEVERDFGIPVLSIVTLTDLLEYAEGHEEISQHADAIRAYREEYGVA